jgi:hypothetical protein
MILGVLRDASLRDAPQDEVDALTLRSARGASRRRRMIERIGGLNKEVVTAPAAS